MNFTGWLIKMNFPINLNRPKFMDISATIPLEGFAERFRIPIWLQNDSLMSMTFSHIRNAVFELAPALQLGVYSSIVAG